MARCGDADPVPTADQARPAARAAGRAHGADRPVGGRRRPGDRPRPGRGGPPGSPRRHPAGQRADPLGRPAGCAARAGRPAARPARPGRRADRAADRPGVPAPAACPRPAAGWCRTPRPGRSSTPRPATASGCSPNAPGSRCFSSGAGRLARAARGTLRRTGVQVEHGDRLAHPVPPASLVVLLGEDAVSSSAGAVLLNAGRPHLAVVAGADRASAGPLVVPGGSACLRCLELHRTDRDPSWPAVAAQLAGGDTGRPRGELDHRAGGRPARPAGRLLGRRAAPAGHRRGHGHRHPARRPEHAPGLAPAPRLRLLGAGRAGPKIGSARRPATGHRRMRSWPTSPAAR